MSVGDNAPDRLQHKALEQLRHDLKTPLITIHGRAQLLARDIPRSPMLTEEERVTMLDGVATIEAAVREMTTRIDAMRGEAGDGGADTE